MSHIIICRQDPAPPIHPSASNQTAPDKLQMTQHFFQDYKICHYRNRRNIFLCRYNYKNYLYKRNCNIYRYSNLVMRYSQDTRDSDA